MKTGYENMKLFFERTPYDVINPRKMSRLSNFSWRIPKGDPWPLCHFNSPSSQQKHSDAGSYFEYWYPPEISKIHLGFRPKLLNFVRKRLFTNLS